MKLKLMVALLALAGLAAALALASPTRAGDGTTTTGGPTAAGDQHGNTVGHEAKKGEHAKGKGEHGKSSCQNVELKGAAGSGTVSFTVSRTEHKSSSLAGKQVTVTIPAGSALSVQACRDASGALTLRGLHVGTVAHATTTTTTTTTATGATGAGVQP
jgi:hypothetical protein